MCGEVLFTGASQGIVADMMAVKGAEGSVRARGRKKFVSRQTVIQGQQPAAGQRSGRLAPPFFGGGTAFDRVTVGQHLEKRARKLENKIGQAPFPPGGARKFEATRPDKFFVLQRNSPLEPLFFFRIPAKTAGGHGVEQFVAENDSLEGSRSESIPAFKPVYFSGE